MSFECVSNPSLLPEAQRIQDIVARADRTIALAGIAGTKFLLEKSRGYGGAPRKPLQRLTKEKEEALWAHENVKAILELERSLERDALVNHSLQPLSSAATDSRRAGASSREVSVLA